VQANPDLAKSSYIQSNAPTSFPMAGSQTTQHGYSDSRKIFQENANSPYFDQPADMSAISPDQDKPAAQLKEEESTFTFIPTDTRGFYRFILSQALSYDLSDSNLQSSDTGSNPKLLSKQSAELLNEICIRWRIPYVSRVVLFLDVVRQKFQDEEISLETLDSAFVYVKEGTPDTHKVLPHHCGTIGQVGHWLISPCCSYY
jgi:hypothetical protein